VAQISLASFSQGNICEKFSQVGLKSTLYLVCKGANVAFRVEGWGTSIGESISYSNYIVGVMLRAFLTFIRRRKWYWTNKPIASPISSISSCVPHPCSSEYKISKTLISGQGQYKQNTVGQKQKITDVFQSMFCLFYTS
jgi:hypothetical protein